MNERLNDQEIANYLASATRSDNLRPVVRELVTRNRELAARVTALEADQKGSESP